MQAIALAAAISIIAGSACAQDIAERFLNDSPSMMDFGGLRLQDWLRASSGEENVAVSYSAERGRILIARLVALESHEEFDHEADCRSWMERMRNAALVIDGELTGNDQYSAFAEFYAHIGFRRTIGGQTEPEALAALDELFLLQTEYVRRQAQGWGFVLERTCTGDLLDTEHAWT